MRHDRGRLASGAVRRERVWLSAILISAFMIRLAYFFELRRTPFFDHLILDLAAYDSWAQRIARGDWLGSSVFYQDPLYPYLLGALYASFGRHLAMVYLLQVALGSLTCYLVYVLARRLFTPAAGLIAAALAATYRPFIFYDVQVEKTFLAVLLLTAACLLLDIALGRSDRVRWIAAGASLALTVLVRSNYLLLLPFVLAGIVAVGTGGYSTRWRNAAWYIAGVGAVLSVTLAHNYALSGDLIVTTAQGGQNFYIGNNAGNPTGVYQAPAFVRPDPRFEETDFAREAERGAGRSLTPSDVSHYWLEAGLAFIYQHPTRFFLGLVRKATFFWNNYEIPDNLDLYLLARYSRTLSLPLPGFALAAALGLCGMVWEARRWRRTWPLYLFTIGYFLTVILFFVSSRYRLPVVPLLLVFAGAAVCRITALVRQRRLLLAIAAGSMVVALAWASAVPIVGTYNAPALLNLGSILFAEGQLEPAETIFRDVIASRPDSAEAHNNLGVLLARRGDDVGATAEFSEAVRLQPRRPDSYVNLGLARLRSGDLPGADAALTRARELAPSSADAWNALASVRRLRGDAGGALDAMKHAAALDPSSPDIHNNLAIALLAAGDANAAVREFDEALRLRPELAEAHFNRAVALERLGRQADAMNAYRHAILARQDYSEAYVNLGNLEMSRGDRAAAADAYRGFLRYWRGDGRTREAVAARLRQIQMTP